MGGDECDVVVREVHPVCEHRASKEARVVQNLHGRATTVTSGHLSHFAACLCSVHMDTGTGIAGERCSVA